MATTITAASVYLPAYRRPGRRGGAARIVTAGFDEDAVTLAAEAVRRLGPAREGAAALLFASASFPYAEKANSATVAAAAGLPKGILAIDVGHGMRAALDALALAGPLAAAVGPVIVVAADCRRFPAASLGESSAADAAVAVVVGPGEALCTIAKGAAVNAEVLDAWRPDGEWLVREAEEHFREDAAIDAIRKALTRLAAIGEGGEGFARAVLPFADVRRRAAVAAAAGIGAERLAATTAATIGYAGTAAPMLDLLLALDETRPGQLLLWTVFGDGAAACAVEAGTRRPDVRMLSEPPPGLEVDLPTYRSWRAADGGEPWARTAPAPHALWREVGELFRFEAGRCSACGLVQYPPQRICARCRGRDWTPVSLADARGTVFTYSLDYVAGTPDIPLVHTVVDFDCGARAMMMLTDRDPAQVRIGMPVEPTFRRVFTADGIHNYLWKVRPAVRS